MCVCVLWSGPAAINGTLTLSSVYVLICFLLDKRKYLVTLEVTLRTTLDLCVATHTD